MNVPTIRGIRARLHDRFRLRLLALALGLAALGGLALTVDMPVARWFALEPLPGDLSRLLDFAEFTAHGMGVAALLASLLVFDPALRPWLTGRPRAFLRIVAAVLASGLVVDVAKTTVPRVRPRSADLAGLESWLATFGAAAVGPYADRVSEMRSFPSGHAAIAAAVAAALCWRYPHGAPVFVAIGIAACVQRLVNGAHYPSDVAFGAALGLAWAAVFLGGSATGEAAMVRSPET